MLLFVQLDMSFNVERLELDIEKEQKKIFKFQIMETCSKIQVGITHIFLLKRSFLMFLIFVVLL